MKKLLLYFIGNIFCFLANAQVPINGGCNSSDLPFGVLDFEDTAFYSRILIDTINYPGNIWRIGKPMKNIFDSAYSTSHAIVTDTSNFYPTNNLSVFELKYRVNGGGSVYLEVFGWYKIDTDTLRDGGTIEISRDDGVSWENIVQDPTVFINHLEYSINDTISSLGKPGFSGGTTSNSINGWDRFYFVVPFPTNIDSLRMRFIFSSDSIPETKNGWMIDNLQLFVSCSSIPEYSSDESLTISPNPSSGIFEIYSNLGNEEKQISIYDIAGKKVADKKINDEKLDLEFLPNGIYEVVINSGNHRSVKRIIINH